MEPLTLRQIATQPVPPVRRGDRAELARLVAHAHAALLSAQPPTFRDYLAMDWLTREAFAQALASFRTTAVLRAGLASSGPLGAQLAAADSDGGAAAEAVFLQQQTALALGNIRAEMEAAHEP